MEREEVILGAGGLWVTLRCDCWDSMNILILMVSVKKLHCEDSNSSINTSPHQHTHTHTPKSGQQC